jgi:hypothetical protein
VPARCQACRARRSSPIPHLLNAPLA